MTILEPEAFTLDPQLEADTFPVAELELNKILICNDSRYLWCILVPRIPDLRDFHDVPAEFKALLLSELDLASAAVQKTAAAYKMNVAALGNMVEQLHIHVIARHRDDPAWPGPIWGVGDAVPYTSADAAKIASRLKAELQLL